MPGRRDEPELDLRVVRPSVCPLLAQRTHVRSVPPVDAARAFEDWALGLSLRVGRRAGEEVSTVERVAHDEAAEAHVTTAEAVEEVEHPGSALAELARPAVELADPASVR